MTGCVAEDEARVNRVELLDDLGKVRERASPTLDSHSPSGSASSN